MKEQNEQFKELQKQTIDSIITLMGDEELKVNVLKGDSKFLIKDLKILNENQKPSVVQISLDAECNLRIAGISGFDSYFVDKKDDLLFLQKSNDGKDTIKITFLIDFSPLKNKIPIIWNEQKEFFFNENFSANIENFVN